jgi:hypothetical protein
VQAALEPVINFEKLPMLFECFKSEQNAPFLAMGGSDGVSKLITGVSKELRRIMSLTGCSNLETIGSELIWD